MAESSNLKPQDIYKLSVQVAMHELSKASEIFSSGYIVGKFNITDNRTAAAVEACHQLFDLALDHLNGSLVIQNMKICEAFDDLRTWLSSAGTYQQTCFDELESASGELNAFVHENFKNSTEYTSNSLAIITSIDESMTAFGAIGRRLLGFGPEWVSAEDRRMLATAAVKADVVVAKDGSGKYKTIGRGGPRAYW
ncbi:hypothetical protein ACP275_06G114700 [Erythranthe tilingii]